MLNTKRRLKDYLQIMIKSIFIGVADLVPGVSGGTIAMIVGIYEELIKTLAGLPNFFKYFINYGFIKALNKCNFAFLLAFGSGLIIGVLLFSNPIHLWLNYDRTQIFAFFTGIVLSCIIGLSKQIKYDWLNIIYLLICGILMYLLINFFNLSVKLNPSFMWIFWSGFFGISAMLLPGISGSYVLIILGTYDAIIGAIKNFNIIIIMVFILGVITGIVVFAKLLNFLIVNYKSRVISSMIGVMLTSLSIIWPWQSIQEPFLNITDNNIFCLSLIIVGFVFIIILNKIQRIFYVKN